MIIKHIDGTETNTNILSDVNAIAAEKAEELRELFCNLKIPFSLVVINQPQVGPPIAESTVFFNLSHSSWTPNKTTQTLVGKLAMSMSTMTGFAVAVIPPDEITEDHGRYLLTVPPRPQND